MNPSNGVELTGWPSECDPLDTVWVFAHNEVLVRSDPASVWRFLIAAENWPRWYRNARCVRTPKDGPLGPGVEFTWWTFGLFIDSTVTEYQEARSLGWCWRSRGWTGAAWGYHAWRLEEHPGGTRVVTEEAQRGCLPWAFRSGLRALLHAGHEHWLRDLASKAGSA